MTGSLQTKNGKYYAVINTTDTNGKRKQKWVSTGINVAGNNKRKAEKRLREILVEYEKKINVFSSDVFFSEFLVHWLLSVKSKVDIITYQGYKSVAEAHIIPYFKNTKVKLCDLDYEAIQLYIDLKSQNGRLDGKGGLAPKTMKTHKLIIQLALKEAVKNSLIDKNPCDFVTLPKMQRREINFYTQSQLKDLFTAIKDEPLYPLIYFTAIFGLRRSEVLGLKWDSINFEANTITIKHTVVRFSSVVEKDTTKTESSFRPYPLSDNLRQILLKIKQEETANRILFGKEYIENDYIFKWNNGKPYSPDYVTSKFSKLLKQKGLPHIRFHDLRHSCASMLLANGYTMKDIQEWLGHADFSTTANIYAHIDNARKSNIAEKMSSSFEF